MAHDCQAWFVLEDYCEFRRLALHRLKLEGQLRDANIPLTHVPWNSMVRAVLTQSLFDDQQLAELKESSADDVVSSEAGFNFFSNDTTTIPDDITETWFEVNQLKELFQRARQMLPTRRQGRREMLNQILGYPKGTPYHWSREDWSSASYF